MKALRTFSNTAQATLAKMLLEGSGIAAIIEKDDCGGMNPFLQPVTGVRLVVREADAERAENVLQEASAAGDSAVTL